MYSQEDVNARWNLDENQDDFRKHTAKNFVCVRWKKTHWEYDCNWKDETDRTSNVSWHAFTPLSSDILVASVDFDQDHVVALNGTKLRFKGLRIGYANGDLNFFPNQTMTGARDDGEFRLNGTYLRAWPYSPPPPLPPLPALAQPKLLNGSLTRLPVQPGTIRCTDNNTGLGFLMWSLEDINERWDVDKTEKDFRQHTTKHFVCVQYRDNTWRYDTNWADEPDRASNQSWQTFLPAPQDILMAKVNFDTDTVADMKGVNLTHKGITLGYHTGDMSFFANQGASAAADTGEFRMSGSYFLGYMPQPKSTTVTTTTTITTATTTGTTTRHPNTVRLDIKAGGIRCTDRDKGSGFIMHSKVALNTRFQVLITRKDFLKNTANHMMCVRYKNGTWEYDTNWEDEKKGRTPEVATKNSWRKFKPVATDVIVASVDFNGNKVTNLKGANLKYKNVQFGYHAGNLKVTSAEQHKSYNDYGRDDPYGEFRAEGFYIDAWWPR
eukprot:TRINITY_DN9369_c0_g2_i1.p1 TRINITY_DN9369_c0_g2~~TRINITY_DN9369_c0_g2_i1.p1  ORF type:complete len:572 (-),score=89.12 TRINITY_DN9369_c0_g2_i1:102-1583(-)